MDFFTTNMTTHFKRIHKLCCMENVPLSAYLLLCQALRNHINKGLNAEGGRFDVLLGVGARDQVATMIRPRFNMTGSDPSCRKVGLLDKHHIWAFLVDPYSHSWRSTLKIEGDLAVHVKEMIEHYVPAVEDGSHVETRKAIRKDFLVSSSSVHDLLF